LDALTTLFWLWGGAAGALVIGAVYWTRADKSAPLLKKLLASSYAPATAVLLLLAAVLPREAWIQLGRNAFLLSQAIPISLLVYSLIAYPGERKLHFLLVPLASICGFWQLGIGTMAIYGK
jgi:hypothetical protein